jgi:cell division protein FtsQ
MKRPEGFGQGRPPARETTAPKSREVKPSPKAREPKPARQPRVQASRPVRPDAAAKAELARAARERKKADRAEMRRFTRRVRNRRIALLSAAGLVAVLVGIVLVAVFSPILALRTVVVEGTARIPAADVQTAVSEQLGTPLALLDMDELRGALNAFPLIRSYTTEAVPPDTLVIRIVERQPVGQVAVTGGFELVDPAGVTIAQSPERTPGYPLIDAKGDVQGTAFRSMAEVLIALPPGMLATVDSVSATTQDDVTLVLAGGGQQVLWGSAEDSAEKALVLAKLIAVTDPTRPGVFDVSAPGTAVFHPL